MKHFIQGLIGEVRHICIRIRLAKTLKTKMSAYSDGEMLSEVTWTRLSQTLSLSLDII